MASDTTGGVQREVDALLAPMRNLHQLRYDLAVIRDSQMTEAEFVTYLDGLPVDDPSEAGQ